jgi:NDP-sugar pyrophosphorylase family protein
MVQFHVEQDALASLAVQDRVTSRYLLFDVDGRLCGRRTRSGAKKLVGSPQDVLIQSAGKVNPLAFSGIHVISPRLLTKLTEEGAFSIISAYLRLAAQQEKIVAFRADQFYWRDLGRSEDLMKAESDLAAGIYK